MHAFRWLGGPWSVAAIICALAGAAHAAFVTMIDNGPSSNRIDMVFLGDGYLASQQNTVYPAHINSLLNHLFNQSEEPFVRYHNFFNVHRVNVVSNEEGADVPPLGIFHDTALDAKYYFDGTTERLLYVSNAKANAALATGLVGAGFTAEMKFLTVNDTRYGGGGGAYAVYAGGNSSATEIALHEQGHSFAGLADEYGENTGTYTGNEPGEVNASKDSSGAKWSQWLGYNQPVIGTIGAYEGARYWDHGLYRPSNNSKMRSLGRPFDAVSREQFVLDFYKYVDPLDSWTNNVGPKINPSVLSVDTIDPSIIDVDWAIDGVTLSGVSGELFNPSMWGLTNGLHTITAHASDPTDWVRLDRSSLEQNISWRVLITPEPGGLCLLAFALSLLAQRRRR